MPQPITEVAELTPARLTHLLRRQPHLESIEVKSIHVLAVHPVLNSTIARLEVSYTAPDSVPAAPRRLFLKLSQTHPQFRNREVLFYETVAPTMTAAWGDGPFIVGYDAVEDPATGRYHVLLEDLSETYTSGSAQLPPTHRQSEQMVEALAWFHAFWWEHPRLGVDLAERPTAATLDELLSLASANLPHFIAFMGDRLSDRRRQIYKRVTGQWPRRRRQDLVAGRHVTLVHRDTHPANFMFPCGAGRARLIDWQGWRIQTGTDDLAYTLAFHWFPERRGRFERELVRRYHQALVERGVRQYSWDDCWYDYRASIIRCLLMLIASWSLDYATLNLTRLELGMLAFEDLDCAEALDN